MLPHLRGRPVTMERYPAGIDKKGFIQKSVTKGFPDWLERGDRAEEGRHRPSRRWSTTSARCCGSSTRTRSRRTSGSRGRRVCIIPTSASSISIRWRTIPRSCAVPRCGCATSSTELGLPSWVKTSGSKGYHIVVPLEGTSRTGEVGAVRARRRDAAGDARSRSPDAGVQQEGSRPADPGRHRPERLQRDVRRRLRGAGEAWRAGVGAVHVGGGRARDGRRRPRSRSGTWPRE